MLFLQYTLLGLVLGGVYGIAASGLVLTYTTSGIFNFAHGAIAMLSAFTYWQFRVGWHWPAPLALFVVLGVLAPLLGAVLYVGSCGPARHLGGHQDHRDHRADARLRALANWIWNPLTPRTARLLLRQQRLGLDLRQQGHLARDHRPRMRRRDRPRVALPVPRTCTGVAMRAVVDDPDLLRLNGGRPERLATHVVGAGAFLAALAGILITPIQGAAMTPTPSPCWSSTPSPPPCSAGCAACRARSSGAIVLGLATNYVIAYFPATARSGATSAQSIPMILLFVILWCCPRTGCAAPPCCGPVSGSRCRRSARRCCGRVILVGVMFLLRRSWRRRRSTTEHRLGFALDRAVAGAAHRLRRRDQPGGAVLRGHRHDRRLPLRRHGPERNPHMTVWGLVAAALVCAVVGGLVALPALRLRGLYLALATMAFGVFVSCMILRRSAARVVRAPLLDLPGGSLTVPAPKIGPMDPQARHVPHVPDRAVRRPRRPAVLLRHSGYGRRLAAMKDSPAACATLGMSPIASSSASSCSRPPSPASAAR